jgi:hypothetical protein
VGRNRKYSATLDSINKKSEKENSIISVSTDFPFPERTELPSFGNNTTVMSNESNEGN